MSGTLPVDAMRRAADAFKDHPANEGEGYPNLVALEAAVEAALSALSVEQEPVGDFAVATTNAELRSWRRVAERLEEEKSTAIRERDEARAAWREAVAMYEMEQKRVDPALRMIREAEARVEKAERERDEARARRNDELWQIAQMAGIGPDEVYTVDTICDRISTLGGKQP